MLRCGLAPAELGCAALWHPTGDLPKVVHPSFSVRCIFRAGHEIRIWQIAGQRAGSLRIWTSRWGGANVVV